MMSAAAPPNQNTGRQRVLSAAVMCFSRRPYAEVSLRDIATEANVDVAYVGRAYGSKAELFRTALLELMEIDQLFSGSPTPQVLIARMCEQVTAEPPRFPQEVHAINMLLRSCTSAEPCEILHDAVLRQFIGTPDGTFSDNENKAVLVMASFLFGLAIFRSALEIDSVGAIETADLKILSADFLDRLLKPECALTGNGRETPR